MSSTLHPMGDLNHLDQLLHDLFEQDDRLSQQHVPQIPGLAFLPEFLSKQQQDLLLQQVASSGFFQDNSKEADTLQKLADTASSEAGTATAATTVATAAADVSQSLSSAATQPADGQSPGPKATTGSGSRSNQVMLFGVVNMPLWLQQLSQQLPLQNHWPPELANRQPLFDTAIINLYLPGDGITPHVDLLRFSDGIAVISLGDPAIMEFTPAPAPAAVAAPAAAPAAEVGTCSKQQCDLCCCGRLRQLPERGPEQQQQQQSAAFDQCSEGHSALPRLGSSCFHDQQHCGAPVDHHRCSQPKSTPQQDTVQLLGGQQRYQCKQQQQQQQLLLQGGDVLLLSGEARHHWQHGIAPVKEEALLCSNCLAQSAAAAAAAAAYMDSRGQSMLKPVAAGSHQCGECLQVVRGRRVSITLRKLDPRQAVLDMQ